MIPTYTCGSFNIGTAKQNILQLKALVTIATPFVSFEPPLSIATKFNKPEK